MNPFNKTDESWTTVQKDPEKMIREFVSCNLNSFQNFVKVRQQQNSELRNSDVVQNLSSTSLRTLLDFDGSVLDLNAAWTPLTEPDRHRVKENEFPGSAAMRDSGSRNCGFLENGTGTNWLTNCSTTVRTTINSDQEYKLSGSDESRDHPSQEGGSLNHIQNSTQPDNDLKSKIASWVNYRDCCVDLCKINSPCGNCLIIFGKLLIKNFSNFVFFSNILSKTFRVENFCNDISRFDCILYCIPHICFLNNPCANCLYNLNNFISCKFINLNNCIYFILNNLDKILENLKKVENLDFNQILHINRFDSLLYDSKVRTVKHDNFGHSSNSYPNLSSTTKLTPRNPFLAENSCENLPKTELTSSEHSTEIPYPNLSSTNKLTSRNSPLAKTFQENFSKFNLNMLDLYSNSSCPNPPRKSILASQLSDRARNSNDALDSSFGPVPPIPPRNRFSDQPDSLKTLETSSDKSFAEISSSESSSGTQLENPAFFAYLVPENFRPGYLDLIKFDSNPFCKCGPCSNNLSNFTSLAKGLKNKKGKNKSNLYKSFYNTYLNYCYVSFILTHNLAFNTLTIESIRDILHRKHLQYEPKTAELHCEHLQRGPKDLSMDKNNNPRDPTSVRKSGKAPVSPTVKIENVADNSYKPKSMLIPPSPDTEARKKLNWAAVLTQNNSRNMIHKTQVSPTSDNNPAIILTKVHNLISKTFPDYSPEILNNVINTWIRITKDRRIVRTIEAIQSGLVRKLSTEKFLEIIQVMDCNVIKTMLEKDDHLFNGISIAINKTLQFSVCKEFVKNTCYIFEISQFDFVLNRLINLLPDTSTTLIPVVDSLVRHQKIFRFTPRVLSNTNNIYKYRSEAVYLIETLCHKYDISTIPETPDMTIETINECIAFNLKHKLRVGQTRKIGKTPNKPTTYNSDTSDFEKHVKVDTTSLGYETCHNENYIKSVDNITETIFSPKLDEPESCDSDNMKADSNNSSYEDGERENIQLLNLANEPPLNSDQLIDKPIYNPNASNPIYISQPLDDNNEIFSSSTQSSFTETPVSPPTTLSDNSNDLDKENPLDNNDKVIVNPDDCQKDCLDDNSAAEWNIVRSKKRNKKIASKKLDPFDSSKWFTDIDIDNFYESIATPSTLTMSALIPELLVRNEEHPGRVFRRGINWSQVEKILCPTLVNGNHWTLLCVDLQSHSAMIYNPLNFENIDENSLNRYNKIIEFIENTTNSPKITLNTKDQCIQKQANGDDCGPLICSYAETLAQNGTFKPNDILSLRVRVYNLYRNSVECKFKLKGGGRNIDPLPAINQKSFFDILNRISNNPETLLVNPGCVDVLASHDPDEVRDHIKLSQYNKKKRIFLTDLNKNLFSLIIYYPEDNLICLKSNMNRFSLKAERAKNVARNLRHILWKDTVPVVSETIAEGEYGFRQILLDVANEFHALDKLDSLLRDALFIKELGCNNHENYFKIKKVNNWTDPIIRRHQVETVLQTIDFSDPDSALDALLHHTLNIRNIENKSPYLGTRLATNRSKSDRNLITKYEINPKQVFEIINNETTVTESPTKVDMEAHARSRNVRHPEMPRCDLNFIKKGPTFNFNIPTRSEIRDILKHKSDSAPGKSNVKYSDLLFADPDCALLHGVISSVMTHNKMPAGWKAFPTILIPKQGKEGSYKEMNAWRPIALLDCAYKIMATCLAYQLEAWANQNKLIHPLQKSLGLAEGCTEHNFILRCLKEKYQEWNLPVHLTFIDLMEAFPNTDRNALYVTLTQMGLSESALGLLKVILEDSSTYYMCNNVISEEIPVMNGVKQGCPLSMLLFNFFINPLMNMLDGVVTGGLRIGESRVSCLAYADDLVILSMTTDGTQKMLDVIEDFSRSNNIKINAKKCGHLHLTEGSTTNRQLNIQNQVIPHLKDKETYRYLGVHFNGEIFPDMSELFNEIEKLTKNTCSSILRSAQKIHAINTFIHSKLVFAFRNNLIKEQDLTYYKSGIEPKMRKLIKKTLKLPDGCSTAYLYTHRAEGGIGAACISDEYYIQSVAVALMLLNNRDFTVRSAARENLNYWNKEKNDRRNNLNVDFSKINKGRLNGMYTKYWHKLSHSIWKLNNIHSIQVRFKLDGNGMVSAAISQCIKGKPKFNSQVNSSESHALCIVLRNMTRISWSQKWANQNMAGFTKDIIEGSKLTNSYIHSGKLNEGEYHFVCRARSNNVPVKARPYNTDKTCRRCGYKMESLRHVLNMCKKNLEVYSDRHNSILKIITNKLKRIWPGEMIIDETCVSTGDPRRVDIQLYNEGTKEVFLIDIKCPFEKKSNFNEVNNANLNKYEDLRVKIQNNLPQWKVELHTLMIGSLGSWYEGNESLLGRLGLNKKEVRWIAQDCCISAIQYGYRIWRRHAGLGTTATLNWITGNLITNPMTKAMTGHQDQTGDGKQQHGAPDCMTAEWMKREIN